MFNHFTPFRAIAQRFEPLAAQLRFMMLAFLFCSAANTAWASPLAPFPGDSTISATICANESYLFNGQLIQTEGVYTAILEASDGSDSTVTLVLDVLPLLSGTVTASICADESYSFNGVQYTQSGTYTATLPGSNGCDSIATLKLTVYPNVITKLNAGICTGTNYVFQGDTLTQAGLYSVVLSTIHGCDSIVQLQLTVADFFVTPLSASICEGKTYTFAGNVLTTAGVYTDSLTAIGGCDSVVVLTLNVRPVPVTHLPVYICEGTFYLYEGDLLGANGVYVYVFGAANGCDSIVMLDLTLVSSYQTSAEATICNGETFVFGPQFLTTAGIYEQLFTAVGGCDSTVTLTLKVLPTQQTSIQATICDGESYEYQGTTLTQPGLYQYVLTDINGCDSLVRLTLNVLEVPNTVIEASICEGGSYELNGELFILEGVYEQILTAESGCDSILSIVLTVLPHSFAEVSTTLCYGEVYNFYGTVLDTSGVYTKVLVAENGCDSTVTLNLTILPILETNLDVAICEGSSYEFFGEQLTTEGFYTVTFSTELGCDTTINVNLTILPTQTTSVQASICEGSTYAFNGLALSAAGEYTAVLTGANGCDSTVNLVLTVLPTQTTEIEATLCQGESYAYFGTSLSVAGTYEYVFEGANGCDSTVIITINVLPVSNTPLVATICAGDSYDFNGQTLTEAGDYEVVLDAANGCDSIVTLHLTVLPLANTAFSVNLCSGLSYSFDGQELTTSGVYTSVATGGNGCDSTTTLTLTFVMGFATDLSATICEGTTFDFNGQVLSAAGVYQDTLSASGGCDSLVTLTLNVLTPSQSVTNASICDGQFYEFNGQTLNDTGTYTATLTAANGCDSIAVLNLTVLPVQTTNLQVTTCANQPYSFFGLSLGQSGNYTAVLTNVNGCDSIIRLQLTVLPIVSSSFSAVICDGDAYTFDGNALTETGTYSATFAAANGCDSLVTLQLSVLPQAQSGTAALVCEGQPYEFNGQTLTQSGIYTYNFPGAGANGCDSVVTLYLTIFPIIPPTNISATICAGETYELDGQTYSTSGTYTAELASATGCDSVVILQLNVLPPVSVFLLESICAGESYPFNGQALTDAGTYVAAFTDVNGCDSTVTLVLEVNVVNNTITLQGGTLTAQGGNNAQYQWIDCATNQPIPNATGSSFTPTTTGQYAVQVFAANGCSATSSCELVQVVAVQEPWSASEWSLQPNPASQQASVMLSEAVEGDLQVEVYDPAGRLLRQLSVASGTRQVSLELTDFPDGMLLVRLVSERGTSSKLLMKAVR